MASRKFSSDHTEKNGATCQCMVNQQPGLRVRTIGVQDDAGLLDGGQQSCSENNRRGVTSHASWLSVVWWTTRTVE
jgi:hypothetical protein